MNIFNIIPVIPLLRIYIKYHKQVDIPCNTICDMINNNLKLDSLTFFFVIVEL